MRRTEAARYARWSAGVAGVLVAITLGVYFERGWVAMRQRRSAPPPAPPTVEKQSSALKFSKVEKNQTLFTVEASRSTEFRGNGEDLLEDVKITLFGRKGDRHDSIHTQSCRYSKESGRIVCSGDVQMDLESAADADRDRHAPDAGPGRAVHVETRDVTFDRESGIAKTDQPVRFAFPDGEGSAQGVLYRSEEGVMRMERDVRLTLHSPAVGAAKSSVPPPTNEIKIHGQSLEFLRDSRTMRLFGSAVAETQTQRLIAGEFQLVLDGRFRAEKLIALRGTGSDRPEVRAERPGGVMTLSADSLVARFSSAGWVEKMEASGAMRGSAHGAAEEQAFQAERMELSFWPRVGQPRELTLSGGVSIETSASKTAERRTLQTSALKILYTEGGKGVSSRPQRAETLGAGSIEWTERPAHVGEQLPKSRLEADQLVLAFGASGRAERLEATGKVQTQRTLPGRPVQTATARSGVTQLSPGGVWAQLDLQGDVQIREGERTAHGEHAAFRRADQTAVLSGAAHVRDTVAETQAQRITFFQSTGDIRAEGGVRSTDLSPRQSSVHLAPQPATLAADALVANAQTGRALYSGHARLWQGDSALEAETIEVLRNARVLNAGGGVRAVFPQAAFSHGGSQTAHAQEPAPAKPVLWRMQSETLTYREGEGRAHLERNVIAKSETEEIRAGSLDLHFARTGSGGAQQLSRAVGTGGVTLRQGGRRGSAERGEYVATEGKFVLSGGTPTLSDAENGATTGRQLTFFLANDTIIVDSENGSRTLTRHRVEK